LGGGNVIYCIPDARAELAFASPTGWIWDDAMGYRLDAEGLSELYPVTLAPGFDLSLVRRISCDITILDNTPSESMGSNCVVATLSNGQTARLGAIDWWAGGSSMTRHYGLSSENILGDIVNQAFSFAIPDGVTVTSLSVQSGIYAPYPPAQRGVKTILLHIDSIGSLSGQVRDLAGLEQPRVRIFNWDLPQQFTEAAVDQDGTWSESDARPWGERYGVYYLSRDSRCPPIVHGPYTAE